MDDARAVDPTDHRWVQVGNGTATDTIPCAVADPDGVSPPRAKPPIADLADAAGDPTVVVQVST